MLFHDSLVNRLDLTGTLQFDTAFRVGSGRETLAADLGVVRDHSGKPFIPGSSLKGVLRSAAERRAEWLGLRSCRLIEDDDSPCLTGNQHWRKAFHDLLGDGSATAVRWQRFWLGHPGVLCDTCRVFGSTEFGGKVRVDDLSLVPEFSGIADRLVEVRDGVGIDRDTGTAVPQLKYNFEVVPSLTVFRFRLSAENLDAPDLALLALALCELEAGNLSVGGATSRGLGRCGLTVASADWLDLAKKDLTDSLDRAETVLAYLIRPAAERERGNVSNPKEFLRAAITDHLANTGVATDA